ncbi:hypothetical protein ACXYN8_04095 [Altererythrobacter sp. CAU 1778]
MSFWTAIVLIVAISTISGVLIERYKAIGKTGSREAQDERDRLREERDAAKGELADLRERVKVLERIATDERGAKQIADEIEFLRDR